VGISISKMASEYDTRPCFYHDIGGGGLFSHTETSVVISIIKRVSAAAFFTRRNRTSIFTPSLVYIVELSLSIVLVRFVRIVSKNQDAGINTVNKSRVMMKAVEQY
jgi:hypothetical protein